MNLPGSEFKISPTSTLIPFLNLYVKIISLKTLFFFIIVRRRCYTQVYVLTLSPVYVLACMSVNPIFFFCKSLLRLLLRATEMTKPELFSRHMIESVASFFPDPSKCRNARRPIRCHCDGLAGECVPFTACDHHHRIFFSQQELVGMTTSRLR